LLKPDGLALIQAITIEDFRYANALKSVDFIKRYIFPGSFIPSVSTITAAMARSTRLGLIELADFGGSYALTLKAWRERFEAAWEKIARWVSMTHSGAAGATTWPTARAAFASARSAMCTC
jgi:cyclopropane-fatty-acyl-phospholipid synthase